MDYKLLGKILSNFFHGIIILDSNEAIIWANDYVKKIFHKTKILDEKFKDLFRIELEEILISQNTIKSYEGQSYSIRAHNITEKDEIFTLLLIESIQDFNNTETKLYCLQKIIESIDDGIVMSDYKGKVVIYNKAMEKLEDMKAKDMLGKYMWDAYKYHLEDKSEHRQVFKSGEPVINKYEAHAYNNGIPKYVSYSTYPIIKDGEKVGVYSISKNETKLQSLLSETIELKRRFIHKDLDKSSDDNKTNGTSFTFSDIVGSSIATTSLIKEAQTIALLENNILIIGDTGTGKEVFAQSIHNFGEKSQEPFIGINCAAIPENLLESILFGSVKGSYTGALDRAGLFEEAKEGTLFLDELNSMPVSMQTKLLRVLQERKVRRVGGVSTVSVKCRVICAINEEPQKLIKDSRLRQDLFYRIAGLILYIPALRDRKEDILEFCKFFINKYNKIMNKNIRGLSDELKEAVLSYSWPGNIRELEHVVENLMVRAEESQKELTLQDMPSYLSKIILGSNALERKKQNTESLSETLRDIEKKLILESLNKNNWNISAASRDLGIIRQSLIYRMKKLNIEKTNNA